MNAENSTSATSKGGRPCQEDAFVIRKLGGDTQLLAVMDGHSGYRAAVSCRDFLSSAELPTVSAKNLKQILFQTVESLVKLTERESSGTTLSLVIVMPKDSLVGMAVLGDSPVVVIDDKDTLVGPDHNVRTNVKELAAAQKRGADYRNGYICWGEDGLQMSRALGDRGLSPILNRQPEVIVRPLSGTAAVLVASDGFVDPTHYGGADKLAQAVKLVRRGKNARDLLKWSLTDQPDDNVTVLLWSKFKVQT